MIVNVRRTAMHFSVTLSALAVALLSSCIVLPIPHQRVHSYGVKGQVIDAHNAQSVSHATIISPPDEKYLVTTDSTGHFSVKPTYGWHGAYLVGPISLSLLPGWYMTSPSRKFGVLATGYEARDISLPVGTKRHPSSSAYLDAGIIRLSRPAQ